MSLICTWARVVDTQDTFSLTWIASHESKKNNSKVQKLLLGTKEMFGWFSVALRKIQNEHNFLYYRWEAAEIENLGSLAR